MTTKVGATSNSKSKAPTRGAKPGERRGGRQKGTPNKINADVKQMVLTALSQQEGGGVEYLKRQALAEPRAFLTLVGKMIPTTLASDVDNPIFPDRVVVEVVHPASK